MSIVILSTLLTSISLEAQKQANLWYFPDHSGLDFSSGEAVLIEESAMPWAEGCSSICDSSGQLLMYATATSVWNRNHEVMPYGDGLLGGNSSTQGALIVPKPESDHIFYLFTLDEFQHDLEYGLRYSLVDMCCDSGLGCVMFEHKNILLLEGAGEKMAATYHSNGTDIWLLSRKHYTNEFHAFLITEDGIQPPVISAIGWENDQELVANSIGQMKISPDGSKIAMAVSNQVPNVIQLFDFDSSSGNVSNVVDLPTPTNSGSAYGVAFSPDNSKLYIQGIPPTGLVQYDLSSENIDEIVASEHHVTWNGPYSGSGIQLANNGKIYVCQPIHIGIIHSPNLAGDACNFEGQAIAANSFYSLPGFIDSFQYTNNVTHCEVGMDDMAFNLFDIYPNPVDEWTTVEIPPLFYDGVMEIRNAMGLLLQRFDIAGRSQLELSSTSFTSGMYFIQLHHAGSTFSSRFMVK